MSSQVFEPNTEASILARVIQAEERELSPEVARYLISMKLPASDEQRVNELSAKARAGDLTGNEARELDSYLHIGTLLGLMQSRARQLLQSEADRRNS
jgi:hypothetical protein